MKTVICGGRHYRLTKADFEYLDRELADNKITMVLHGAATGADEGAAYWAESRKVYCRAYPALWLKLGKAAGPIRNRQMAQDCDRVIAFPGGIGTASMIDEAIKAGKAYVIRTI